MNEDCISKQIHFYSSSWIEWKGWGLNHRLWDSDGTIFEINYKETQADPETCTAQGQQTEANFLAMSHCQFFKLTVMEYLYLLQSLQNDFGWRLCRRPQNAYSGHFWTNRSAWKSPTRSLHIFFDKDALRALDWRKKSLYSKGPVRPSFNTMHLCGASVPCYLTDFLPDIIPQLGNKCTWK